MSYSTLNPAWDALQRARHAAMLQEEIATARALQAEFPAMTWGQALKAAAPIVARRGAL